MHGSTTLEIAGYLFTTLVLGAIGYSISHSSKHALSFIGALLIVLATMAAGHVGNSIMLISIFGLTVFLNHALQGLGFGLILGFMTRKPGQVVSKDGSPA